MCQKLKVVLLVCCFLSVINYFLSFSLASGSNVCEGQTNAMDVDDTKSCTGDETSLTQDFTKHSKCQIIPQRAALLKSILNFFKKAILDPSFSDSVRTGLYIQLLV